MIIGKPALTGERGFPACGFGGSNRRGSRRLAGACYDAGNLSLSAVMSAILQKSRYLAIPDFRNLGVMLRILLLVNLLLLVAAILLRGSDPLFVRVLTLTAWVEPALLLILGILALLSEHLMRQRQPYLTVVLVCLLCVSGLDRLLTPHDPFPLERPLLAMLMALLLMHYFWLRQRALSPALSEARLAALQARIRPHFLFNSLNAAIALIRSKPDKAEMVLENLADLFRAQMADPGKASTLAREVELARMYLAIEAERVGERLQVSWDVQAPADAVLPALLLQPLVENAVHHGVECSRAGGVIHVAAHLAGKQLVLSVTNPLSDGNAEPHKGNRMALDNLRERLALFYDAEAQLEAVSTPDRYCAIITVPYQPAAAAQH